MSDRHPPILSPPPAKTFSCDMRARETFQIQYIKVVCLTNSDTDYREKGLRASERSMLKLSDLRDESRSNELLAAANIGWDITLPVLPNLMNNLGYYAESRLTVAEHATGQEASLTHHIDVSCWKYLNMENSSTSYQSGTSKNSLVAISLPLGTLPISWKLGVLESLVSFWQCARFSICFKAAYLSCLHALQ